MINGMELMDVIRQVNPNVGEDTEKIHVFMAGPGGLVTEGNKIYDYLNSLKKDKKYSITTETIGNIGSMMTKIFLVGDERIIRRGDEFFIHNPWVQPEAGDANKIQGEIDSLRLAEEELRAFYVSATDLTEETIKPYMDEQKGFSADEAITMKFATAIKEQELKAVAMIGNPQSQNQNNWNMDEKAQETFINKIVASLKGIVNKDKGSNQNKKNMKNFNSKVLASIIQARTIETEESGMVWVDAEDLSSLEGVAVMTVDAEGMPTEEAVSDGVLTIKETGDKITVKDGKVESVEKAEQEEAEIEARMKSFEAKQKQLEETLKGIKESVSAVPASIEESIKNVMSQVGVTYVPSMGSGASGGKPEYKKSAIALRMQELQEKEAEKRNK